MAFATVLLPAPLRPTSAVIPSGIVQSRDFQEPTFLSDSDSGITSAPCAVVGELGQRRVCTFDIYHRM